MITLSTVPGLPRQKANAPKGNFGNYVQSAHLLDGDALRLEALSARPHEQADRTSVSIYAQEVEDAVRHHLICGAKAGGRLGRC